MHFLLILLVVVVVLGGLSLLDVLRAHRQGRERSLVLGPLAKRLGLSLDELPQADAEALGQRLLGCSRLRGRAPLLKERVSDEEPPASLALRGELDGERVTLLDLAPPEEGALPTSVVVLEPAGGLLRLSLQRRSAATPLAEIVGDEQAARYEAIADFGGETSAAATPAGPGPARPPRALFGDDFLLEVHEEDLPKLRPLLLRGSLRELIEAHRDEPLCVESLSGARLLVHDLGRTLPGGKVERRLRDARKLAAALAR